MSFLIHLGHLKEHFNNIRQLLPQRVTLSTTQKVLVVSLSASVVVVGVLAKYLRRKKRIVDPAQFRRNIFSSKRSRASGVRSPNGDLGSIASSGRRSAAFSNIYGDKYGRQGSAITSEKGSIASGSGVSGGHHVAEGGDGTHLTPQQLGVMDCRSKVCTCTKNWIGSIGSCKCMAQKSCKNERIIRNVLKSTSHSTVTEECDSEASDDE